MKHARSAFAVVAILAAFAVPAHAQSFAFQGSSFGEGAPMIVVYDISETAVSGYLRSGVLHLDAQSGNWVGTGHFLLQGNGVSIDDQGANVIVLPDAGPGAPSCANARVHYIGGVVVAGNSGGLPYAVASSIKGYQFAGECPYQVLQCEGAFGSAALHTLDLSHYSPRVQLQIRQATHVQSFGSVKSLFR